MNVPFKEATMTYPSLGSIALSTTRISPPQFAALIIDSPATRTNYIAAGCEMTSSCISSAMSSETSTMKGKPTRSRLKNTERATLFSALLPIRYCLSTIRVASDSLPPLENAFMNI